MNLKRAREADEAGDEASEADTKVRWIDLLGIDPDFTGGMDVKEFLEKSRGEA